MAEYIATRNPNRRPSHPGVLAAELITALNRPLDEVAAEIGISPAHLDAIMKAEKPITPEIAAGLGRVFGDGPAPWLRMQGAHDAWRAP